MPVMERILGESLLCTRETCTGQLALERPGHH